MQIYPSIQCAITITLTFRQLYVCIDRKNENKLKTAGRKLNLWKEQDMCAAVREVKDGKLKLRVAA